MIIKCIRLDFTPTHLSFYKQALGSFQSLEQTDYKKLSYRKQIACKLRREYVEGIYCSSVTLKSHGHTSVE